MVIHVNYLFQNGNSNQGVTTSGDSGSAALSESTAKENSKV